MDPSRFGIQTGLGDFTGRGHKRPHDDDYENTDKGRDEAYDESHRMGFQTTGRILDLNTTHLVKNVGWSKKGKKGRKLHKAARRLNYIRDASGSMATWINEVALTQLTTVADQCKYTGVFLLTGESCGSVNGNDIFKLFSTIRNEAAAGSRALILADDRRLFVHKIILKFQFNVTSTIGGLVDMYECIALKDHNSSDTGSTAALIGSNLLGRESAPTNGTALVDTNAEFSPYLLHEFGQYWKIIKTWSLFVKAADNVTVLHPVTVDKLISPDVLITQDYFGGLSRMYFVKVRGEMGTAGTYQAMTLNMRPTLTYKFTYGDVRVPYVTTAITAPS